MLVTRVLYELSIQSSQKFHTGVQIMYLMNNFKQGIIVYYKLFYYVFHLLNLTSIDMSLVWQY
jgi:hypothetical protein